MLEQRDGKLNRGSLCAVAAAKKLGGSVTGLIAGKSVRSAAEEAARGNGMGKVLMVDSTEYEKVCAQGMEDLEPRMLIYMVPRVFQKTMRHY